MNKRVNVFKKTDDNWYPNYFKRLVEVSYVYPELTDGTTRVCVWGADDFGMHCDYKTKEEAYAMFEHIIALDVVNMDDLKALEFEQF